MIFEMDTPENEVHPFECLLRKVLMSVTVKDLRYKTRQVLNRVRRGDAPVITFRGCPVARIIPLSRSDKRVFKEIGFGIWRDHDQLQDVNQWLDEQRKPRHPR